MIGRGRGGLTGIGSTDAEDPLAAAQLTDPAAVPFKISITGVAEVAGMSVDDADDAEPPVLLPEDPAREFLGIPVEADVGESGLALRPRRQGSHRDGTVF